MTEQEIYTAMLERVRELTGYAMHDDAELAVRLHAAAAQIAGLYAYADYCLKQAFAQTAAGTYLDYHGSMRDLQRRPASRATGKIRFRLTAERTVDIAVPAGTVCTAAETVRYETLEDAVIPAGSLYADVAAQASLAGASGNAQPDTIVHMTLPPVGVGACTNPQAFSGGADEEDDESFRERILQSFRRLPNGSNTAFYRQRALQTAGVAAVRVLPRNRGRGTVDLVISATAGVPDEKLLESLSRELNEERELAVDVAVLAPQTVTVDIGAQLTVAEGYDAEAVLSAAQQAVRALFDGSLLGCSVYRARIGNVLYTVPGVENYRLLSPAEDVAVGPGELPVLGQLQIVQMTQ